MKITKGTIVRTILAILVIVNIILERMGYDIINVDEYQVGMVLELLIEIAIIVVGFWKNNSFSEKAIRADEFLRALKNSETSEDYYVEDEEIEEEED